MDDKKTCSLCGFVNIPDVRFCGGCGEPLVPLAVEEERKDVAILFADICNFTELVAASDPEETKDKIERCLLVMSDEVARFSGVVEKFIGDSIMAVFGVPATHENDAELAVRAGLCIVESIRDFGAREGLNLEVRVGVHFGEVIVSRHSPAPGRAHHVFGSAVNLASRLETTGLPGAVVASDDIYKRTREFFDFQELPRLKVKGVREELNRHRVTGEKAVRGKTRGIPGLVSPLVGREEEMTLLRRSYREAAAGKGLRLVSIVGEAGIGKTRLVEELLAVLRTSGSEHRVLHGRCLGYAGAPPYYPFAEIIKKVAGLKEEMRPEEIAARLDQAVTGILGERKRGDVDAALTLKRLLAFSGEGETPEDTDTKQFHNQVLLVMERLFGALAHESPLVLIFEDVQWSDSSSLALIGHLARSLADSRCLLLINSRPPGDSDGARSLLDELRGLSRHRRIELKDLSPADTRRLVSELLSIEKIDEAKRQTIIKLAAGNPFFVEEILKDLIERGEILFKDGNWFASEEDGDLKLPETVEGVLRSRIDNLPSPEKKVIQRASVVGEIFWRQIVTELSCHAVVEELQALERRELIHRRLESLFEDDLEYIFKHILLHETVYKSLLHREKRELHNKTARWVERNYADRRPSYHALTAHHYEMGGAYENAARHYYAAGIHAASLYANEDAERFYAKAVEHAREGDLVRRAYLEWGNVCLETGSPHDSIDRFTAALAYVTSTVHRAELMERMGSAYQRLSEYPRSLAYYEEALSLLKDEPSSLLQCKALNGIAWLMYLWGKPAEALRQVVRSEEVMAEVPGEDFASDTVRARVASIHATILNELNRLDEAKLHYRRALELSEKHGHLIGMQSVLNNVATVELKVGHFGAAIELLLRSAEIAERCGDRLGLAINYNNLGDLYNHLGALDRAEEYFARYLEINTIIDNRLGDGYACYGLAFLAQMKGEVAEAEEQYRRAIEIYAEVGATHILMEVKLALAVFYAEVGREEAAEALFGEVEEVMGAETAAIPRACALGLIVRRRRLTDREKDLLSALMPVAREGFDKETDRFIRMEAATHLAALLDELGEGEKAAEYRKTAQNELEAIAKGIGDVELEKGFRELMARRGLGV